jgi:hypothetical protein
MTVATCGSQNLKAGFTYGLTQDLTGTLCTAGGGGGGGGTSSLFNAAFPASGTAVGALNSAGTNMVPLNLDSSGNLKVTGGTGGTASNFGSAFPTAGTAAGFSDGTNMVAGRIVSAGADALSNSTPQTINAALSYIYNGTSWDRTRGDTTSGVWANIKTSVLPTGASTSANQTSQITQETAINTVLGLQADSVCGSATGSCTTQALLKFLNNAVTSSIPAGTNTIGNVNGAPNLTPTDCSGAITTGGTAQNAFSAGATKHGFTIVNIDTSEPLWISFTTTAAASTAASYPLQAATATTFASPGSFTTPMGFGINTALSVIAVTTGHKFSCTWW